MEAASCVELVAFKEKVVALLPGSDDYVAIGLSRLDGSIWDGRVALHHLKCEGGHAVLSPVASVSTEVGVASLAWCGVDGNGLAGGLDSGDVQVYRVKSDQGDGKARLEPTLRLTEHDDTISAVASSPDGTLLASGSWDSSIRLWNLGSPLVSAREYRAHASQVTALAWGKRSQSELLASGGRDYKIKLWDNRGKEPARVSRALLSATPMTLEWADESGQLLAAGLDDGSVVLYDTRDLSQALERQKLHGGSVSALAFSGPSATTEAQGQGSRLWASGGDDTVVRIGSMGSVEGSTFRASSSLRGHRDYVTALAWVSGADGSSLLSGGWDGRVLHFTPGKNDELIS